MDVSMISVSLSFISILEVSLLSIVTFGGDVIAHGDASTCINVGSYYRLDASIVSFSILLISSLVNGLIFYGLLSVMSSTFTVF